MCVENQYLDLRQKYPYLFLEKKGDRYFIYGTIFIEKDDIRDQYEVEIQVSLDYPKSIPVAKETGSKIASGFHKYDDGTLCLETPLGIHEVFRANQTLINFVDNLLVPYLYTHSYYQKTGEFPFGQHAHGAEGVLEDYKKRFNASDDLLALRLLQILVEQSYRGHHKCLCGSEKKLRNCHGKYLYPLLNIHFNFMKDFLEILGWLKKTKNFDVSEFITSKIRDVLIQIKANPNRKWN